MLVIAASDCTIAPSRKSGAATFSLAELGWSTYSSFLETVIDCRKCESLGNYSKAECVQFGIPAGLHSGLKNACLSAFQSLKDFHQTYTNEHSRSCYNVIYSKSRLRPFVPFGHVFGLPSSIVEVGFDRRYINE
jgi:hypothetical protein